MSSGDVGNGVSGVVPVLGGPQPPRALHTAVDGRDSLFARCAWLAARATRAPMALITSVEDAGCHCVGSWGMPEGWDGARTSPLPDFLARPALASDVGLGTLAAAEHDSTSECAALRGLPARGYASVLFRTSAGQPLGVLAVLDTEERAWAAEDMRVLRELAALLAAQLEACNAQSDVTERRVAEERLTQTVEALRTLALLDELTGLHNRRGFTTLAQHWLQLAQKSGRELLLFFADLDDLKRINDSYGHEAGDCALRDAARLLRATFRESDLFARIGGDEFVVLACDASRSDADLFATRLDAALRAYNATQDLRFKLSISTGATVYDPRAPEPLETLLRRADAAMYRDKRQRRTADRVASR